MSTKKHPKTDKIKAAGPDKIKAASEKAQKEMAAEDAKIELSVCGAHSCHPLSMARKLAIHRFVEACPDADETEIMLVSTYVLSLPQKKFWQKARQAKSLLDKAAEFADTCDSDEFQTLMEETSDKIAHLQESSEMNGSSDTEEAGNVPSSPE